MILNFFYIKPIGALVMVGRGTIFLAMEMFWLLVGITYYKSDTHNPLQKVPKFRFAGLLYLFLIPSMVMATTLFGQTWTQNLITYRTFLLFLAIPALFHVAPSEKDVIKACTWIVVLIAIVTIVHTYIAPSLFFEDEKAAARIRAIRSGAVPEFLYPTEGLEILVIVLYYYCGRVYRHYNSRDMMKVLALFLMLAVFQSRSNLFPAMLILGFTIIGARGINVYLKTLVIVSASCVLLFVLGDMIAGLFADTQREMSTSYDPRIVALEYFSNFNNRDLPEIFFGTGAISFQTSNYVKNLQAMHIHYSDLGFIGFWHQFGIIPISMFIYSLIRGFVNTKKNIPIYVKFLAIHITICGATISYFDIPIRDMWFCLFYYLYWYYRVRPMDKSRNLIDMPSLATDTYVHTSTALDNNIQDNRDKVTSCGLFTIHSINPQRLQ